MTTPSERREKKWKKNLPKIVAYLSCFATRNSSEIKKEKNKLGQCCVFHLQKK
jgi:hypothetical protein